MDAPTKDKVKTMELFCIDLTFLAKDVDQQIDPIQYIKVHTLINVPAELIDAGKKVFVWEAPLDEIYHAEDLDWAINETLRNIFIGMRRTWQMRKPNVPDNKILIGKFESEQLRWNHKIVLRVYLCDRA